MTASDQAWSAGLKTTCIVVVAAAMLVGVGPDSGPGLRPVVSVALFSALVGLAYCDFRWRRLPDFMTLPLTFGGVVLSLSQQAWEMSVLGAAGGYLFVAGLRWVWMRSRQVEAIGLGDAKLLMAGGAWLGPLALPFVCLAATSAALVVTLGGRLLGRSMRSDVAFGAFLVLGFWAVWCFPVVDVPTI